MRILIINEYILIRKALSFLLNMEDDIQVLDDTDEVLDAIGKIQIMEPDIVIMSSRLDNRCSADLILECNKRKLNTKFIVLSSVRSEQEFKLFLKLDVEGFLLMKAKSDELILALRTIHKGKKYFDSSVIDFVLNDDNYSELTPRELDVLMALGKGMNNKCISENLYISEFTVKKHVGQILSKLNLRDRTEAALFANANGICELN